MADICLTSIEDLMVLPGLHVENVEFAWALRTELPVIIQPGRTISRVSAPPLRHGLA